MYLSLASVVSYLFRRLYSALWYMAGPLVPYYLHRKSKRHRAYLEHSEERFGYVRKHSNHPVAILHAVSVGETRAAQPLLRLLCSVYPEYEWILCQGTPTGRSTAMRILNDLPVRCMYLPYDHPKWLQRWFDALQPQLLLLMETEIWPNLLWIAKQRNVPSFIINARLSEHSAKSYHKVRWLLPPVTEILCQSEGDRKRFQTLSYTHVTVCGNTKFDIVPPPEAHRLLFSSPYGRKSSVAVVGSSREGEELEILKAWKEYVPQALLVIIPRHPERFLAVEKLIQDMGFNYAKRSRCMPEIDHEVWLGDSMGELWAYYQMADWVLVGGSLHPFGCHSFIEPLQLGKPTYVGPSVFNVRHWFELATQAQVLQQVPSAEEWVQCITHHISNPNISEDWTARIRNWLGQQQGACPRIAARLRPYLEQT